MSVANTPKLFAVDDDLGLLRLVRRTLEREGFQVATAPSGAEAIAWLEKNQADLLLLDLKLQDVAAVDLIDQLSTAGRLPRFIIITGQGDERMAVEMMKRGALDYVVKDTNFLEFLPTLVRHALAQVEKEKRLTVAEKSVQESEERFRRTLDNMIEGCQTLAFDWRYLYVNQAAARHGRRSVEELLGRSLLEVHPGIEKTPLFAKLAACMETRRECHFENEFTYPTGESAWFQLSVQPVPEGLFILSLDITHRKEIERLQKLQYDTALLLAESKSLPDAVEKILKAVCCTFHWDIGELWRVNRENNVLRNVRTWCGANPASSEWGEIAEQISFAPGIGLPGAVWLSAKPAYVADLAIEENCSRGKLAVRLGLTSGFAFPIILGDQVLAVMTFFGRHSRPLDEESLECLAALGSQIGQFVQRKQLERAVLEISDAEQGRIGRDLHDGLGQQLTALELFSVSLAGDLEARSPKLAKSVKKMGEHLREAIKQTRAMANGLSPVSLDEGGLVTAFTKLAEGIRTMAKVDCKFLCPAPMEVSGGAATHLYRIAQEATNNALKHGRASKIRIALTRNEGLQLTISDNGCGFSSLDTKRGMGISAMKYRADLIGAELRLDSEPGKGTSVTCTLRKLV